MHFDIFNNDAFSLSQLTLAMNDSIPQVPGLLAPLFDEEGVNTLNISIESVGSTLKLVPSKARGAPGTTGDRPKRNLKSFSVVHLPQQDSMIADEIQGVRAFGSENDLETAQNLVNKRLAQQKMNIDATMEWGRIGAIKGQVLDSDGTSVLLDLFTEFGVTQSTLDFALDNDATKVKQKCVDLTRGIKGKLNGLQMSGVRVLCSASFFDALVSHPAVEKAYDLWMDGQFKREQQRNLNGGGGFFFGNVYWEEYDWAVDGHDFIADGDAYAIPGNVPQLFKTYFGPADYVETVNTIGLPYYARLSPMQNGKGFDIESQSNPLHLCTRPAAIFKLTA